MTTDAAPVGVPSYGSVLQDREVFGLLASRLISLAGDQVARVALMVLVFDRTRSATLAAAAYACSYLSSVLAGPLLGGLADRRPRRTVIVVTDLLRAALFLVMAIPALPITGLLLLVLVATALDAPFAAARASLMRDVTGSSAAYSRGTGLDEALDSSGQIVGFAVAGVLLVVLSPTTALLLNAASFVLSALIVRGLVQQRAAAAARPAATGTSLVGRCRRTARVAVSDARQGWAAAMARTCRRPVLLTWAGLACAIAPEALAAPWAHRLGAGSIGVGLLFAAAPAGNVIGVLLVGRVSAARAQRWLLPLTLLAVVPLMACATEPPLLVALLLVALSGVGTSFSLVARVQFVDSVVDDVRGRAFSVAATGVMLTQGLGILGAAVAATFLPPPVAVAACGAAGLLLIAVALLLSRRPAEPDVVICLVDVPGPSLVEVPGQRVGPDAVPQAAGRTGAVAAAPPVIHRRNAVLSRRSSS